MYRCFYDNIMSGAPILTIRNRGVSSLKFLIKIGWKPVENEVVPSIVDVLQRKVHLSVLNPTLVPTGEET